MDVINKNLLLVAETAVENIDYILSENQKDLALMAESDPRYDRLTLTEGRIKSIAFDIRKVVELPDPVGHVLMKNTRPNGLIINNAKTRRVSVCNALDCLIIHEKRLDDLDYLVALCSDSDVVIYADKRAYEALTDKYPSEFLQIATRESFGTEFLSYKMAIKTVSSFDEAVDHISEFGSKHSEAIISENKNNVQLFYNIVDASAIYSNASTAFTDGSEFGLGAEIGISTQKLHARGPMALEALTTYKWIIEGNGQIRK